MKPCLPAVLLAGLCVSFAALADEGTPAPSALPPPAAVAPDFERDIRPLFVERCASCHGAEMQRAGLRLDVKADALRGGDGGAVILPGNSEGSKLIALVAGLDPKIVMPPKGERLTPDQIGLLRAWIDGGAEWPEAAAPAPAGPSPADHWAFKAPVRPEPPLVSQADRVRNPIDAFVLARLEREGIAPSPEADRATLIRRLSLDLTGLPPAPEEVDAFVGDPSPYAYESLVNRLLASPHFGEQWGRHWLDIARYADSDGFEKDTARPHAWRYRQWVIDALNRDMPYDQFVVEQLAGDLLPNATVDQKVATGFHRNTLTNKEGGVDPEQFRVEQVVDRTNTTGAALMGLTVGCAQCHNHKYDPISQREYYQFYAFFNTSVEADIPAPLAPEVEAYKLAKAQFDAEHAKLQKAVDDYKPELAKRLPQWESEQRIAEVAWTGIDFASTGSAGGATFARQADGSLLVGGNAPRKDTYTLVAVLPEGGITGLRLEVIPDASLPKGGSGRAANGNFVLSELKVTTGEPADPTSTAKPVAVAKAWADYAQEGFEPGATQDGKGNTGWATGTPDGTQAARTAEFVLAEPSGFPTGTVLTLTLDQQWGQGHTLGRFRVSYTTAERPVLEVPADVRAILLTPAEQRNDAQRARLLDHLGESDPRMRELKATLDGHGQGMPKPPATQAQTLAQNPAPPKTHIHTRGDFLRPGEEVQPATPAILPPLKPRGAAPDRLDLARWLMDPGHPLTSRVAVNRIWEHLFDRGLVYTSEDFGTRSEPPSHPDLLDWLATEYPARGWSLKEMLRLIVTSATYRQSSAVRPELNDIDPRNILLARQTRFRVSAENIRDAALAASGLLNPSVGGPSVRPPLPKGIAELGYAGSVSWPESPGDDRYRRGLYVFFQRTVPYPMLMTFDCPDSNVSCLRRMRSNTPLQALTLLNDPVFFECAQAFGRRIAAEAPGADEDKVRRAFRQGLGRAPTEPEVQRLTAFYREQRGAFEADPAAAEQVLTAFRPEGVAPAEAAACVTLGRVILNLDEFVTRE